MIQRTLAQKLKQSAKQYPVITLTGPRQSGKTTLLRDAFPKHTYVSLESPDHRDFAQEDPRGFLNQFQGGVILDEVQRVPDLMSYIQGMVDADAAPGRFILSGSQNFLLLDKVSQSLAGRSAILHLLPLSHAELRGGERLSLDEIGIKVPRSDAGKDVLLDTLWKGFYPRIHDKNLDPADWLGNYYQTYVERDVRSILNVGDLETFSRFVRLCAGRSGQLLNLTSLGADCGISHATAKRWISVLEASFIVYLLRPHHQNFSKRMVKSPKLYFLDTGLLCFLLRIRKAEELAAHSARGAIFESFVVSEMLKAYYHRGLTPDIYFWRDMSGHEVDIVMDEGATLVPIEVKSGETVAGDFFKGLEFWRSLPGQKNARAAMVYGGDTSKKQNEVCVYSWRDWL